jgi:hypothetical protein
LDPGFRRDDQDSSHGEGRGLGIVISLHTSRLGSLPSRG